MTRNLPDDDAFHGADEFLSGRVATPETGGVKRTLSGLADTVPGDFSDAARRLSEIAKPLRIDGSATPVWGVSPPSTPHAGDLSDDVRGVA